MDGENSRCLNGRPKLKDRWQILQDRDIALYQDVSHMHNY